MIKVYLAGGMRKREVNLKNGDKYLFAPSYTHNDCDEKSIEINWQYVVEEHINNHHTNFTFLNPLKNDIKNAFDQYATLDLYHAKASDIVFGYLEADNPAGHGLAVECGYAKGLGKTVIIVNETKLDDPMYRYKKFIEKSADIVFTNFVEGVLFLEKFQG